MKEYKKMARVMKVMVRFYVRGEAAKKAQHEDVVVEMEKIDFNLEMAEKQLAALQKFPSFHPKRKEYEAGLTEEMEELKKVRAKYQKQADGFHDLHEWGLKIVDTMNWLEGNLKHYANQKLATDFPLEDIRLTPELYKIYKAGLAEVTYNLQESQDFFEASLDGRLHLYHEIERDMIKAQLEVLKAYPEGGDRVNHFVPELEADLAFVLGNMEDNPKVRKHRERMQQMHKDFFALLKWQRKKMIAILENEPEKIDGDVEQLKKDLEAESAKGKVFQSKYDTKEEEVAAAKVEEPAPAAAPACPMGFSGEKGGVCPVTHSDMAKAFTQMTVEEKKKEGFIHKLYEDDTK
eukprot:TRINITY_DN15243_c0_g1_i1.p1 TRINITY_DN15243_c0_g1~~TRINITY_DN15243_c0_g1_i1.p1  ORF type:complete len:381 (-),score=143.80 TRINITY_DN15243_c0_g1_i1:30-1073(-)